MEFDIPLDIGDIFKLIVNVCQQVFGFWDGITIEWTYNGVNHSVTVLQLILGIVVSGYIVFEVVNAGGSDWINFDDYGDDD